MRNAACADKGCDTHDGKVEWNIREKPDKKSDKGRRVGATNSAHAVP